MALRQSGLAWSDPNPFLQEPVVRVRAPVVDMAATVEEEEESIAALFSR